MFLKDFSTALQKTGELVMGCLSSHDKLSHDKLQSLQNPQESLLFFEPVTSYLDQNALVDLEDCERNRENGFEPPHSPGPQSFPSQLSRMSKNMKGVFICLTG